MPNATITCDITSLAKVIKKKRENDTDRIIKFIEKNPIFRTSVVKFA